MANVAFEETTTVTSKAKTQPRFLPAIVVIGLICACVIYYYLRSPSVTDFRLHQSKYEAIVARAKGFKFQLWQEGPCYTNAALDPDSLSRKRVNHDSMVGMIYVRHTDAEPFQVSIITRDQGHLGTSGYIYSEATDSAPSTTDLPSADRQIGPHWWIASNNLW